jgi:hypothetical protein
MAWKLTEIAEADCPEYYAVIHFHQLPSPGQQITCHVCDTRLEVIRTNPLRLGWNLEEDLDYDDFDDEGFTTFNSDDLTEIEEDRSDNRAI